MNVGCKAIDESGETFPRNSTEHIVRYIVIQTAQKRKREGGADQCLKGPKENVLLVVFFFRLHFLVQYSVCSCFRKGY